MDVLEAKGGIVIVGVLPRPKKYKEGQNDHIGDETRGYQLCHYDVIVAQLVATCFIISV